MALLVKTVEPGSPAQKFGVQPGDELLSAGGNALYDMLDYEFYTASAAFELLLCRSGEKQTLHITKEEYEPLGCDFATYLADKKHSCDNHCMFCFIDQLPKGLRDTLYFKDDDERLSFLYGNYVTLTNMSEREMQRIKTMHISPINVSVHTTNPQLRVRMMANKRAAETLRYLDVFAKGGIDMNCQLVLCRGINDGDELRRTLDDLLRLRPQVESIAAVPAGVTAYRKGLFKLTPYDQQSAAETLDIMEEYCARCRKQYGRSVVYPSDEWYLLAGREVPPAEFYDNYDQLEDGVGMWRMYHDSFWDELQFPRSNVEPRSIDVVTGTLAAPLIREMAEATHAKYPQISVTVHAIQNDYFGGTVSVAGLVTGTDIIKQCKGNLSSNILCVPEVMLRDEKDRFLDDITVKQLGEALGCEIEVIPTDGAGGCKAYLGELKPKPKRKKLHFSFGGR